MDDVGGSVGEEGAGRLRCARGRTSVATIVGDVGACLLVGACGISVGDEGAGRDR